MQKCLFVVLIIMLAALPAWGQEARSVPDLSTLQELDLQTAQRVALVDNPGMAAAQARVEQAKARVRQAVAAWWPQVELNGSGSSNRASETAWATNQALAALSGTSIDQTTDNYTLGLQATWNLFNGFATTFQQQRATFDEQSTVAAFEDSQRLLVSAVAEGFFNAQLAQTRVDIAEADKAFYLRQLEDAENRYEVGAGPWGDVLNIKVQLNSALTSLLLSRREFEAAGYGLAALLGIGDGMLPHNLRLSSLDQDVSADDRTVDIDILIAEALALRPDLQQLDLQVKGAEAGVGTAKSAFYPKVQLAGDVSGASPDDINLSGDDFGNSLGLQFAWSLFNGGADRARLVEARQQKRELLDSMALLKAQVTSEIRQNVALLEAAREQVILQRETVGLVEENRDLARNEYEAGEAFLLRLNEAQRDLTTTYGRLAQALVSYHLAHQRLLSVTGKNLIDLTTVPGQE